MNRSPGATWIFDLQQGDSGKGAATDYLARFHDAIARCQGGDNAGHSIEFRGVDGQAQRRTFRLLPSGSRFADKELIVGNGVLVNPQTLMHEVASWAELGVDVGARLKLSHRAHLVMPYHIVADSASEQAKAEKGKQIGTTNRGIGPCNISKVARIGIRVADLNDMDLVADRIRENLKFFQLPPDSFAANLDWLVRSREFLQSHAYDTAAHVHMLLSRGKRVLVEGAQGTLIDCELGTYPYVTTSPTCLTSVISGLGVDPWSLTHRVGLLKAYATMSGGGPFVTELHGAEGDEVRRRGGEFDVIADVSKPRRVGWLDLAAARWGIRVTGCNWLLVTKLDCVQGMDKITVCTGYVDAAGRPVGYSPECRFLDACRPVYRELPGWSAMPAGARSPAEMPANLRNFLAFVSTELERPIAGIRIGPGEADMLLTPEFAASFGGEATSTGADAALAAT